MDKLFASNNTETVKRSLFFIGSDATAKSAGKKKLVVEVMFEL